jgi:hypothetical protein
MKAILTNRKFMSPIIGAIASVIVGILPSFGIDVAPDFQVQLNQFIWSAVLLIVGGDIVYDNNPLIPPPDSPTPQPDIFKDIDDKNTNNPTDDEIVRLPVAEPESYSFDLTRYDTRRDYEPDRQVHVPPKAVYNGVPTHDTTHPNVNINSQKGTEFAIDSVSGDFSFMFDPVLLADGVTYEVSLKYFANINGPTPLNQWAWHRLIAGDKDTGQVHGIENGAHEIVWIIEGNGKLCNLIPTLHLEWANAHGSSIVQWHDKLLITPQKKA